MQIKTGLPPTAENLCNIAIGGETDEFLVEWRLPDDDAQTDILCLGAGLSALDQELDPVARVNGFASARSQAARIIREHFIKVNRDDYSDGDLDRMLSHNPYLFGLLSSLRDAKGVCLEKNALKRERSGQRDDSLNETVVLA